MSPDLALGLALHIYTKHKKNTIYPVYEISLPSESSKAALACNILFSPPILFCPDLSSGKPEYTENKVRTKVRLSSDVI